jgi:hypothetical protein
MTDFNSEAAVYRGKQLYAARLKATAQLAEAEADGNIEFAAEQIAEIAAIDSAGDALNRLHQNYVQQRNPPQQVPQTDGEFQAKAPERMDYADVQRMTSKSKYGAVSDDEMRRGITELARRKSLGSYKDGGN